MGKLGLKRIGITLVMVALLLAGGCGSEAPAEEESPWVAELKQRAEKSDNEYVKRVFSDGRIEAAELSEAEERMSACLAEYDIEMRGTAETGIYYLYDRNLGDEQYRTYQEQCGTSTGYDDIDFYWQAVKQNPGKVSDPLSEYLLPCLKRNGLADESLTAQEWLELSQDDTKRKAAGDNSFSEWDRRFARYAYSNRPDYDAEKGALWQACMTDPANN